MFLFPYRAQIKLRQWPVMTIAVSVACLLVYLAQSQSDARVQAHAKRVCERLAIQSEDGKAAEGYQWGHWNISCEDAVQHIHHARKPDDHLDWHVRRMEERGDAEGAGRLRTQYRAFAEHAPVTLTARLWHDRSRLDPVGMLTSIFAHASWEHVIFNLLFFFAFAAAVELILGPVLFLGSIVLLSFAIGFFDQMIATWEGHPWPSLGLSGVVMGMLALFVYFLPRAKIRFAFWFLLAAGTFAVPAWLVAAWYVSWDLLYQMSHMRSGVNYVAHLAGAAFGLGIGVTLFRAKRHWAADIVEEKLDLTQDETWLTKLNFIAASGAVLPVLFILGLVVFVLVARFIHSFGLQLLLMSPVLAAAWYLHRMRQAARPVRDRYQLGVEALERRHFDEAHAHLKPLADVNDTRALHALARLHASATGAWLNEPEAARLCTRAAERDYAPAQHLLGAFYADGRGVEKNTAKAIEWYEKAARAGVPEAASSLGYLYETGPRSIADPEKAVEWYYRAGVSYYKAARLDDARAMIKALQNTAGRFPAAVPLIGELEKRVALKAAG
jgi:membrane associated rhomboid family serine protease